MKKSDIEKDLDKIEKLLRRADVCFENLKSAFWISNISFLFYLIGLIFFIPLGLASLCVAWIAFGFQIYWRKEMRKAINTSDELMAKIGDPRPQIDPRIW